ncbi:hypothetical protein [Candidatus Enterovibrio escicola]|uniref:hypothetical protein n=1 Tax=Candidatus Enterovibrio escicola TaxID=1927127 RepID=UPI0012380005|nr:hypothetical protein [Candidatus Enterovibrio escacola]
MVKTGVCLFLRVSYWQVILTLLEQLRIPFHNHSNQTRHDFFHISPLFFNFVFFKNIFLFLDTHGVYNLYVS